MGAALTAASHAYCPHFGEVLAGCALRSTTGQVFPGSSIRTWSGNGGITPLAMALIGLGAHGGTPRNIHSVTWIAKNASAESEMLRAEDEALFMKMAPPNSTFQ